jgi:hypothetical protein
MLALPAGVRITRAVSYEVRISGRLDDALLRTFADLDPTVEAETALRIPNSALYQVLGRLRRSGLEVVQVRQLPTPPEAPVAGTPGTPTGEQRHR